MLQILSDFRVFTSFGSGWCSAVSTRSRAVGGVDARLRVGGPGVGERGLGSGWSTVPGVSLKEDYYQLNLQP